MVQSLVPIQVVDVGPVLNEAITEAQKWESHLGHKHKGKAEKAFEALRAGRIEIGNPQAHIQRLYREDFEKRNLTLSPEIERSLQGKAAFSFYIIPIPVLLYPGRGAQYQLVESEFTFNLVAKQREHAIQSIFPEPFWKPVLNWGGQMKLALDANLQWGAEVAAPQAKVKRLGGQLAGRVSNTNELGSFITVMPFEHSMGRMEIEAQYSSKRAMWRLDSRQAIRSQKHAQFVILLKVPKEVCRIELAAAAQAKVSFDWLTAQIDHVRARFSEMLTGMLDKSNGLPLQDFRTFILDLPDC